MRVCVWRWWDTEGGVGRGELRGGSLVVVTAGQAIPLSAIVGPEGRGERSASLGSFGTHV